MLDRHLSINEFIDYTFKEANWKLYILRRIRGFVTNDITIRIDQTCIILILDYDDFIIENRSILKVHHLENIQKRALKPVNNYSNKGCSYEGLLDICGRTKLSLEEENTIYV